MPRPRKIDRPIEKRVTLPESLVARVELELYSDLEGKVPFGAWQRLLMELITRHLDALERARAGQQPTEEKQQ